MTSANRRWPRLTLALTTGAIATAGLFWAAAQAQTDITAADLPGGQAHNGGGFFDYVADNSYFNIGVHYMHMSGSSNNLTIHDPLTRVIASPVVPTPIGPQPNPAYNPDVSPGGEWAGTGIGADSEAFAAATFGLYLPHTGHHLAIETMLAPPLELSIELRGQAIDTPLAPHITDPVGKVVGTTQALSPNITFVYRPWVDTMIQPYIGVGVMYLYTYDTDVTNTVLNRYGGDPSLSLSKEMACVGQVGVDVNLPHDFYINADVKYIGCAQVKNELTGVNVRTPSGIRTLDKISATLDFEALLYSLNIGMRF